MPYRILLLDTKQSLLGGNQCHYIAIALGEALRVTEGVEQVVMATPANAAGLAVEHGCNLFIAYGGELLNRDICTRLREICGRAVVWFTEDPYERVANQRFASVFDLVFTTDADSVATYGAKGRHLPLAASRGMHFLPVNRRLHYQLFFSGSAWPNRVAFFRDLLPRLDDGHKLKLGLPWSGNLPAPQIGLPDSSINWRTPPPQFARLANRSAATIVLPRDFSTAGHQGTAGTPPPRLFEAALAGSVQLVHSSVAGYRDFYQPDREILVFDSQAELLDHTRKLQSDPEWRIALAEAGQARTLRDHTYHCRARALLDAVESLPQPAVHISKPARERPHLLLVAHNLAENGSFGGIEVYLELLRRSLRDRFKIFAYVPDRNATSRRKRGRTVCLYDEDRQVVLRKTFPTENAETLLTSERREDVFHRLLRDFSIDLVHFHHIIGHTPSLMLVAHALGIPSLFTVHDYYPLCRDFTLIDDKGAYCGPATLGAAACDDCMRTKYRYAPGAQQARRNFWQLALQSVDTLLFNTIGSAQLTTDVMPCLAQHPDVRVLPVPTPGGCPAPAGDEHDDGVLHVAMMGNFSHHKGAQTLLDALPLLTNDPMHIHVFGRIDGGYRDIANDNCDPRVTFHGVYDNTKPPQQLYRCRVSLHLSIWPETYCLTLSEARALGLVPVVTDIGALAERVRDGIDGCVIPVGDSHRLAETLQRLAADSELLTQLRNNIDTATDPLVGSHLRQLVDEYLRLIAAYRTGTPFDRAESQSTALVNLGLRVNDAYWAWPAPRHGWGGVRDRFRDRFLPREATFP